jgi:hypothetical protein
MKKLLTICLLLAATLTVNAQEKPSKEVTVKFIEANLKKSIGTKDRYSHLLTNVSFDGNVLILTTTRLELEVTYTETYSDFDWEGVRFSVRNDSEKSTIPGFEVVQISFETSYKQKTITEQFGKVSKSERLFTWLIIHMPSDKIESLKKAFLRLQEIANEENKDPFAN